LDLPLFIDTAAAVTSRPAVRRFRRGRQRSQHSYR
jgi:hypothetical protein